MAPIWYTYQIMKRSFDIYYEDKDMIVVIKKSGLLSVATDKDDRHNLYHYVREYLNNKKQKVFIVHRLDKDTSGLVVFAKSIAMKEKLQSYFENGNVLRHYEAIVKEHIEPGKRMKVEQYLAFDPKSGNVYVTKDKEKGKRAVTYLQCDHTNKLGSVLNIDIKTGRRNQIRLACKTLGLTLIGDSKYANDKAKRMFLNEYELEFPKECNLRKSRFALEPLWLSSKKMKTVKEENNCENESKQLE